MKIWETKYNGNTIRVENAWSGEKLFVNGQLQDKQMGIATRSRLWGELPTGEAIKVSLGGHLKIHCLIFIDNKLILEE